MSFQDNLALNRICKKNTYSALSNVIGIKKAWPQKSEPQSVVRGVLEMTKRKTQPCNSDWEENEPYPSHNQDNVTTAYRCH